MNGGLPSAGILALIAAAGGLGAVLRYALDGFVHRTARPRGPAGIFLVNVLASVAVGVLAGTGVGVTGEVGDEQLGLVLTAGLLGGFSTLSTVALDSARLAQARRWGWLLLNTAGMLTMSVIACVGARALAAVLIG